MAGRAIYAGFFVFLTACGLVAFVLTGARRDLGGVALFGTIAYAIWS